MRPLFIALAPLLALFSLAAPVAAQEERAIDFGDDASDFASDGECDDARFEGEGMAIVLNPVDIRHDAEDCSAGVAEGRLTARPLPTWRGEGPAPTIDEIDFGDDESSFAFDDACDDPRFGGYMMAGTLIESDVLHDASDCRQGVADGTLVYRGIPEGGFAPVALSGPAVDDGADLSFAAIGFGDDASAFAHNGECDDGRFRGEGMATFLLDFDIGHDATDCGSAAAHGRAILRFSRTPGDIDFGDDASSYSFNLECDDPRFEGGSMAGILLEDDIRHDASDCRAGVEEGSLTYIGEQG